MSEGTFRLFAVAVFGTVVVAYAAEPPEPPVDISPTGIITNTAPLVIGSTNSPVPIVEGGTNSVLNAEEQKKKELEDAVKAAQAEYEKRLAAEKKKWQASTNNLGIYHVIPAKDPFKLFKPEIEKPKPIIVARPTFGVPHLAGISLLNGVRAVLRVNPPRGGKAQYVRLQEGEMLQDADNNNYGEVLKIDVEKGIVQVQVKGQTFPLEIDRSKMMASSSKSKTSSRRPTTGSSSRRPTSGSSSRRPTSGSSSGSSSRGSSSRPPSKSGGSLQTVPSRRRKTSSLNKIQQIEPGLYELPAFNETVQKFIINPLDISSQREIIRGQFLHETPTDLPPDQR